MHHYREKFTVQNQPPLSPPPSKNVIAIFYLIVYVLPQKHLKS